MDAAKVLTRAALTTVLLVAWPAGVAAQDAHYATYQYGPRANLLGGAVLGSAVDVSGVFYNPGALASLDSVELIASAKVFELTNLLFEPEPAGGANLNDLRFDEAPGFFGGTLPFSFLGSRVLAYSIFTRYRFKSSLGNTRVTSIDTGALQGDALFKLRLDRDLSEQWFGLTYAAPRGRIGLGISQFLAYRSQSGNNGALGEVFPGRGGGAISLLDEEFSYWHTRLLWKLGVSFDWAGFSFGVTATTPSVSLAGSGRLEVNNTVAGQDADGDDVLDPLFVAAAQEGLSPTYKSPWSLGAGVTFKGAGTDWFASAEYFGKVSEYSVLDGEDFINQTTGDTLALNLTTALEQVINFSVGIQRQFSRKVTGFVSFWTDFSARPEERDFDLATAGWDILFISAGSAVQVGSADITFGLAYGWGSQVGAGIPRDDGINDEITGELADAVDLKYRSLRLMIAFSI